MTKTNAKASTKKTVDPIEDKFSKEALARFVDQPGQFIGTLSPAMKRYIAEREKEMKAEKAAKAKAAKKK